MLKAFQQHQLVQAQREVAYEAGPCGFVIARRLKQLKVSCLVAAAPLI